MKKIEKFLKILLLVFFINSFIKLSITYINNKRTISELKIKIAQEESLKNDMIEKEKVLSDRYKDIDNPKEIEKIAREILNLQKEGEEVYRIVK